MSRRDAREIALHAVFEASFGAGKSDTSADGPADRRVDAGQPDLAEFCAAYKKPLGPRDAAYARELLAGIDVHLIELDGYIEKYSKGWGFGRISRVAVAAMRIAMYEMLYMPEVPDSVSINEAVEMLKRYDDEDVPAFVNGILSSFYKENIGK